MKKTQILIGILRLSAFTMVFSRGFLYLFHGSPFRSLFWSESLFTPVVRLFGMTWRDYANTSDPLISLLEKGTGLFLIISSILFLTVKDNYEKTAVKIIKVVGFLMLFHIFLHFTGHNQEFPIIPEYMIQGLTPWLFLACLASMPVDAAQKWQTPSASTYFWLKFAISCCFLGHGLYAFGIPYQPASFVRLMSKSLFIEFETAALLVKLIGMADIVLAVTVFIKPWEKITLGHMAFWGFATAFSRVFAHVIISGRLSNFNPWFFESTVRVVHGAIPLFLLLLLKWEILEQRHPRYEEIKSWFRQWQVIPAGVVFILFILAGISSRHSFAIDHDQVLLAKLNKPGKRRISVKNKTHLRLTDFQKSAAGAWYSDELFATEIIPTRLVVDLENGNEDSLSGLPSFLKNRKIIQESIHNHIIKRYLSINKDSEISGRRILKFTQKIQITYDNAETLNAKVHVPWLNMRIMNLEINQSGQISEVN